MTTTPNLLLPNIEGSQSQKHVTHNAALQFLDMFVHAAVKDRDLAAPPGSPSEGDRYLIAGSATDVWSGHSGQIAGYYAGTWIFGIPIEGWRIWVMDEDIYLTYNGSAWVADSASGSFSILGVNTTADATNKLSVSSSAILFNHIGNGVQVKLNKNAAGDSASFLYQTGFSGRAEFGTLGDNNFTLKVSPDGSAWSDALKVIASTGRTAQKSIATGLTAAGTNQGTALVLTKTLNEVTTTAAGTGVILPTPEPGEALIVANQGANTLNIYPATGGSINALATNTAITLVANARMQFWATSTSKWYAQ